MDMEKVMENMNIAKAVLCNPNMVTPEMCIMIGQTISDAISLLKEQETADTGRCRIFQCEKCGYGIEDIFVDEFKYPIDPRYCPNCGRKVRRE